MRETVLVSPGSSKNIEIEAPGASWGVDFRERSILTVFNNSRFLAAMVLNLSILRTLM